MRRESIVVVLGLMALLLGGCGTATSAASGVSLAESTAAAAATATPRPTTTLTAIPTTTATPRSLATLPPSPPPPRATSSSSSVTPFGGYSAQWGRWAIGEQVNQFRRSYDPAKDEYHVALLAEDQQWSFFAPEGQKFEDFALDLEAHPISGPDTVGYGIAFRRQKGAGDARYVFYVTPQGRFSLLQVNPDGQIKILRPLDAAPAGVIRVGNQPNRLSVTAIGTFITLSVNGEVVFRLTNATITGAGEVGIFVIAPRGTVASEVAFSKLQLSVAVR